MSEPVIHPMIWERMVNMRPEESIRVVFNRDKTRVSFERLWRGLLRYQLEGPIEEAAGLLFEVLPKTTLRDEKGFES